MKVLIVDDERTIRETVKEILEDEGFEIFIEEAGSKVIGAIEKLKPDILILDLFLPGISGMEILKELHERGITQSLAVVIISGHGTVETSVKAMKLGAFDFLEKPIKYDKLIEVIEDAKKYLSSENSIGGAVDYLSNLPLKKAKEEFEKTYIKQVLKRFNGDLKKAATFMEIDISNLYRKLNKYGLNQ
ncbi:two component transcriptional regulator, Fis family [Desulfurobacterium thermolithotrophum DSM 11699]|uniref:Two component transcriptional regulator, Fis family n=1 Tax=Desulfurobacterium thermolithotrophum (strain DSM 11699 / BSA) TaxID=868864 RepID=F0S2U9_DESTD|nr:response regulator [Desulfurobacterium thermolithotrophum]ADY73171.1 two component transcriptional regulator, Fis family [Desulfurobacterium thermolithotrophum DSM 11699]